MDMTEEMRRVCIDRNGQYGDPLVGHNNLADIFTGLLNTYYTNAVGQPLPAPIPGWVIPVLFASMKLNRIMLSPNNKDSYVDAANYTHLAMDNALRSGHAVKPQESPAASFEPKRGTSMAENFKAAYDGKAVGATSGSEEYLNPITPDQPNRTENDLPPVAEPLGDAISRIRGGYGNNPLILIQLIDQSWPEPERDWDGIVKVDNEFNEIYRVRTPNGCERYIIHFSDRKLEYLAENVSNEEVYRCVGRHYHP